MPTTPFQNGSSHGGGTVPPANQQLGGGSSPGSSFGGGLFGSPFGGGFGGDAYGAPRLPGMMAAGPSSFGGIMNQGQQGPQGGAMFDPNTPGTYGSQGAWDFGYRPGSPAAYDPIMRAFFGNLSQGGKAGAFDPGGSQGLLDQLQRMGLIDQGARERATNTSMQSTYGLDPSAYGYGHLMSMLGAQGDTANAMNQARTGSMMQNQQYLQQLAEMFARYRMGAEGANQQAWLQENLNPHRGGIGGALGGLIGTGLGGVFGGLGRQIGTNLGAGRGWNQGE